MEVKEGYKKTEIGIIPEDWSASKIEKCIDLLTGYPFPSNRYSKGGIKLLRGSNIKRGETDWSEEITKYWSTSSPELKKYELSEDDIVVAMDGSLVGRSFAQLTKRDLPALLLQRVARIRTNKIDINYLKELVCGIYFTVHCDKVKTSSAIPHISPQDIKDYLIPIPPTIEEQQAIAEVLTDTDNLIQALEKQIAKKKLIKQGVMQQLLTPKEGWVKKKLGDIAELITKGTTPTSIGREFQINGINFIKIESLTSTGDIIAGKVAFIDEYTHKLLQRSQLKVDDILFSIAGALGRVAIVKSEILPANTNQALSIIRLGINSEMDLNCLFVYLSSEKIQTQISNMSVQGAQANLSLLNIAQLIIEHPELKTEQTRIAVTFSDICKELQTLENKLSKYKSLKQGLMQQLLAGKIRLLKS